MATSRVPIAIRLIAMAAGISLLFASGACSSSSDDAATSQNGGTTTSTTRTGAGSAAIFTPSDGITISQRTPLNKWAKLTPEITDRLVAQGMRKGAIEKVTSDSLDKQSRDVQDWVVDHMTADDGSSDSSNGDADPSRTTLIVAPVVEADSSTRQYGDYVTRPTDDSSSPTDSSKSDSSSSSDASSDGANDVSDEDDTERNAYDRLNSALKLARDAGMHVILLANGVDGFSPDAFVSFSTPEQIGMIQATKLVAKLDLAKASKDNPKAIEVLIPSSPASDESGSDSASSSGSADGADETTETDDAFAREAFAGMWKVLQPYFSQGKAYSPSGLLTKATEDSDWRNVTVSVSDKKDISDELDRRLPQTKTDGAKTRTRIDGIIAMNDYVASVVTDELDALGYTGSAADINPSITISGIVGNITGRKDLHRGSVPDPAKSPETDDSDSSDANGDSTDAQSSDESASDWPIVTGFGGYVDTMPQVVNGKQWMTGLENRKAIAADIAEVTVRLNRKESAADLKYVTKQRVPGSSSKTKVNTIAEEPLSVSAYNLKTALIDPGYITMADAGL
ncbi:hypothetical protein JS528_00745 [Bifidobacterium sp. MA2]|uniref:Periplasmic binding protein domain-containing protein n=1 Tax=Bifidobacterium santillanense TaxID=2809028 RepID=A0ABS5ULY4_9BIFI|nr:hypothetical protein [Bifidobacterium santillanense]MBT1171909.1 hypothetical protein [Bifidobacterium santillanense]